MVHKGQRLSDQRAPKIGDVVLVKEIDLRRGEWNLGRIQKIKAPQGYIKAATVILPNHQCIERPISWLFPVECASL